LAGSALGALDDAGALYGNPAALQWTERRELWLEQSRLSAEHARNVVAAVFPHWARGERRTAALGLSSLATDSFDVVRNGAPAGSGRPWEAALTGGYARPLGVGDVGASFKWIGRRLITERDQALALDAGWARRSPDRRVTGGVVLANLGTNRLPLAVRAGAGYRPALFGNHWLLTSGVDVPSDEPLRASIGAEYAGPPRRGVGWVLWSGVRLGAGDAAAPLSLGAGLAVKNIRINYAFNGSDGLGDSHRFDVRFLFGEGPAAERRRDAALAEAREALEEGRLLDAESRLAEARRESPRHGPTEALAAQLKRRMAESLDPDTLFLQGRRAAAEGDARAAAEIFRRLLLLTPDHAEAAAALKTVEADLAAGRDARMKADLSRARTRAVEESSTAARRRMERAQWAEAALLWRKVLALSPDETEARQGLAACRERVLIEVEGDERAERWDEAVRKLQTVKMGAADDARLARWGDRLVQARARRASSLYEEGLDAYRRGDSERAAVLFRDALVLTPGDRRIQSALRRIEEENRGRRP
jgi:tetratricopeptide (TPR) repeat protein